MIRIGYFQFNVHFGKKAGNLKTIVNALKDVEADLIVLPELALTGYLFSDRNEAIAAAEDPRRSSSVDTLVNLCRDRRFHLVTGFAERDRERCFNSAVLLGPEGLISTYRKLHLFGTEKQCFDPGDLPLEVQQVGDVKIGIMICFDWIFPEVARVLAVQGADVLCHCANLVMSYCQQAMLTRCLENNVFAVTANRYGSDHRPAGSIRFTGKSQIVAPMGSLLHRAASQRRELFITEIDPAEARDKSITAVNHLMDDRRPRAYGALCDR